MLAVAVVKVVEDVVMHVPHMTMHVARSVLPNPPASTSQKDRSSTKHAVGSNMPLHVSGTSAIVFDKL